MRDRYNLYENLYRGYDESIHAYNQFDLMGNPIPCDLFSTNNWKKVAEDWASLIVGEKLEIKTNIELLDNYIDEEFVPEQAAFIEQVFAIGQGTIIPYQDEYQRLTWNYFIGNEFEVLEWYFGRPKKMKIPYKDFDMFVDYDIGLNKCLVTYKANADGVVTPERYEFLGKMNYFKPNIANNKTLDKQGISVLGNAIDYYKVLEVAFNDRYNEFNLGKKRLFVDKKLLIDKGFSEDGKDKYQKKLFDPNNTLYQMVNGLQSGIQEFDSSLRVEAYIAHENRLLLQLGDSAGLTDFYQLDASGKISHKTATEVISEKDDLYRNKKNHEQLLSKEYKIFISALFGLLFQNKQSIDLVDISLKFDDSIIADDAAEFEKDMKMWEAGLMSDRAFISKHRHLSDEEYDIEIERLTVPEPEPSE